MFTKESIPNKKIHVGKDKVLLEVRCDNKQPLFISPSLHKDGNKYAPLGTDKIELVDDIGLLKLKAKLTLFSDKYMSDEDRERYDSWLDAGRTILGVGAGRHDATKFKIIRNYWKHDGNGWLNYTDEQRFEDAWQWHLKHCQPPRTKEEFDRLCEWVKQNHRVKRDEFFEKIREQRQNQSQADSDINSLPQEVQARLSTNVFSLIGRNPLRLYVADDIRKEIMKVVIAKPKDVTETTESNSATTTTTTKTKTIKYTEKDTIIDAIPTKVIINDNPLDGIKTYQVTFQHKGSRPITIGPGSISYLLEELQSKGRFVADREAKQALTGILVKYEDTGMAEITCKPPQYGYFWIDNQIVGFDTTQQNIDPNIEADRIKMLECINVLDTLYQKSKHKTAFATVIRWGVMSSFSYARKFINEIHNDWIPDLQAYGQSQTGKGTFSMYVLAIWRLHTKKYLPAHRIGFAQADTKAKHGRVVSQTTYPVTVHETGELSEPKYYDIVEQQKNKVEFPDVRGKHRGIFHYEREPAMASLFLTGNPPPPSEVAYRIRVLPLSFDLNHCTTEQEKLEFDEWLYKQKNIDKLSILGDFAAKYIIEHTAETLKDLRWEDASKLILSKFYEAVGRQPPEWINLLEKPNLVQDDTDQTYARLRALFEREILEGYRRDSKDAAEYNFETKLERCLKLRSVTFLTKHLNKQGTAEIAITYSFMDLLSKYKISNIGTLAALASHMEGFEYQTIKLNGKTVKACNGSYESFRNFLGCQDEVAKVDDDNEDIE